jgi:hypothetical protein
MLAARSENCLNLESTQMVGFGRLHGREMDDLAQGGVYGGSQCARSKDLGCLTSDISIHINRCLGHTSTISRESAAKESTGLRPSDWRIG